MSSPTIEVLADFVCVYCADRDSLNKVIEKESLDNLVKEYQDKKKILFYLNNKHKPKLTIHTATYKFI